MGDGYAEALAKLDRRMRELEEAGGRPDDAELKELRAELDRLKAAMAGGSGPGPRRAAPGDAAMPSARRERGGVVPEDPGLTRDLGRTLDEPSSDSVLEEKPRPGGPYRGLREPVGGAVPRRRPRTEGRAAPEAPDDRLELSETTVGKYVVGVLAAVMVVLGVCVGIGSFWAYIPDSLKFLAVLLAGLAMAGAGEHVILGRHAGLNGFWQALAGCGFMVMFVAVTAGVLAWELYGLFLAGILYILWFLACFACAGRNGSRTFYALAYIGGLIASEFAMVLTAWASGIGQAVVCVMPALVILIGLADAARTEDSFLWFLNAVFSGLACLSLSAWASATSGPARWEAVCLAGILLYCSQRLFRVDGGGMAVLRTISTFGSCWLLAGCCEAAFLWLGEGPSGMTWALAGPCLAVAIILGVFAITGMSPVMALGSAPATAVLLASAGASIPFAGPLVPMVVCVVALGSGYCLKSRLADLAAWTFSVVSMTAVCLASRAMHWGEDYPFSRGATMSAANVGTILIYVVVATLAYAVGYRARRGRSENGYGCLGMILGWTWACLYFTGADCMGDGCPLLVLAVGALLLGLHWFDLHEANYGITSGMRLATIAMGLFWIAGLAAYEPALPGVLGRILVLVGVPALVLATGFARDAEGIEIQLMIAWCDLGMWIAALSPDLGIPVAACGLAMACASALAVWQGFRLGRKDIRMTGLTLTILHVLVIAGATAMNGGTLGVVLSLLGAGAVCFGISFAYNKLSAAYDGEGTEDAEGGAIDGGDGNGDGGPGA